jgi:WXG100 family type VII secretion target
MTARRDARAVRTETDADSKGGSMAGNIKVTGEEIASTASQFTAAAANFEAENNRLMQQAQALVEAAWEGRGAEAFTAAFARWRQGAEQVHEALTEISTKMGQAQQAYTGVDESTAASFG